MRLKQKVDTLFENLNMIPLQGSESKDDEDERLYLSSSLCCVFALDMDFYIKCCTYFVDQ